MSDEFTTARNPHRYILELGRGGMGTVYLTLTHGPGGFNKLKVVKVLNAELAGEPEALKMFLNEARLAALLNHRLAALVSSVQSSDYRRPPVHLQTRAPVAHAPRRAAVVP